MIEGIWILSIIFCLLIGLDRRGCSGLIIGGLLGVLLGPLGLVLMLLFMRRDSGGQVTQIVNVMVDKSIDKDNS